MASLSENEKSHQIGKADGADCKSENLIENEKGHRFGKADGADCGRKLDFFLKNRCV